MVGNGAWSGPDWIGVKLTQARAAADVLEAEQQQAGGALAASGQNGAPKFDKFDFKQYMAQRAELVNQALDASVPMQYPELVNESMRCTSVSMHQLPPSNVHKKFDPAALGQLHCQLWHTLLVQCTAAAGFTLRDPNFPGVHITCAALVQVLAAGRWQAGTAGTLPGSGRAGRWQRRAGHAVGVCDGDDPHHEPHPR